MWLYLRGEWLQMKSHQRQSFTGKRKRLEISQNKSSWDEKENVQSHPAHLLDIRLDPKVLQFLFDLCRLRMSLESYEAPSLSVSSSGWRAEDFGLATNNPTCSWGLVSQLHPWDTAQIPTEQDMFCHRHLWQLLFVLNTTECKNLENYYSQEIIFSYVNSSKNLFTVCAQVITGYTENFLWGLVPRLGPVFHPGDAASKMPPLTELLTLQHCQSFHTLQMGYFHPRLTVSVWDLKRPRQTCPLGCSTRLWGW